MRHLESEGFEVTYLDPKENGLVDLKELENAMTDKTVLVSIMHVNNEIGVIQDLESIGALCRDRGIVFHVDAAQSPGKVEVDVEKHKIDVVEEVVEVLLV